MIGIGSPERLKHQFSGFWSRRINLKDRLIYKIEDKEVIVYIISLKGHYYDK
jgi:toxin YoeB